MNPARRRAFDFDFIEFLLQPAAIAGREFYSADEDGFVIENGGHGGTAAAPAAAQVIASYFHVKVQQATSTHSD